jgi:DNA topoisomerase-6 subunit A
MDTFNGERFEIDASKQGRSGWAIPSDVDNDIEFTDVKAKSVLVVEKDALWQRLNEDGFWKKENMILISPQGQASRGTRRLIRKLADLGLPIYVFNDGDAWGWYIYWTIKTGSMNLAYISSEIATPEAKFIGVTMSDVEHYDFLKKMTMRATEVDLKRAQEMLSYSWINRHKEWVVELKKVLTTKQKLEQDTLQGPRLTFVDDYIREKIKNKDFLP